MKQLNDFLTIARTAPVEELPGFLGLLEIARAAVLARFTAPATAPVAPPLEGAVSTAEAARLMGFSASYLFHHWKTYPFCRKERGRLVWSRAGIDGWIRQRGK